MLPVDMKTMLGEPRRWGSQPTVQPLLAARGVSARAAEEPRAAGAAARRRGQAGRRASFRRAPGRCDPSTKGKPPAV